jgi:hypothetical protein
VPFFGLRNVVYSLAYVCKQSHQPQWSSSLWLWLCPLQLLAQTSLLYLHQGDCQQCHQNQRMLHPQSGAPIQPHGYECNNHEPINLILCQLPPSQTETTYYLQWDCQQCHSAAPNDDAPVCTADHIPKTVKGFDSSINTEVVGVCMTKEGAAVVGN